MVSGGIREALDKSNISGIRRIAFIIVDAETTARPSWSIVGDIPGIGPVMELSSTVMVNKYNYETIDLLRRTIKDWQVEDEAKNKPLDFYIIHLAFNTLPEKTERDYFHSIPTSYLTKRTRWTVSGCRRRLLLLHMISSAGQDMMEKYRGRHSVTKSDESLQIPRKKEKCR
jgi:hypothetical protein